jgi:hypothetical protein
MSLESKLTEEQKSKILTKVRSARTGSIVKQILIDSLEQNDKQCRLNAVNALPYVLPEVAKRDYSLWREIFDHIRKDKKIAKSSTTTEMFMHEETGSLGAVIEGRIDQAVNAVGKLILSDDEKERKHAYDAVARLDKTRPDLTLKLLNAMAKRVGKELFIGEAEDIADHCFDGSRLSQLVLEEIIKKDGEPRLIFWCHNSALRFAAERPQEFLTYYTNARHQCFVENKTSEYKFILKRRDAQAAMLKVADARPDVVASFLEDDLKIGCDVLLDSCTISDPPHAIHTNPMPNELLRFMARKLPDRAVGIYRTAIDASPGTSSPAVMSVNVSASALLSLDALAQNNPDGFLGIVEENIPKPDKPANRRAAVFSMLRYLPAERLIAIASKFEGYLSGGDEALMFGAAKSLPAVAKVAPEDVARLYRLGADCSCETVREAIAEGLGSLIEIAPDLAVELYTKGFNDCLPVKRAAAKSLKHLVPHKPDIAENLFKVGFSDDDTEMRANTAEALAEFGKINVSKFSTLYNLGRSSGRPDDSDIMIAAALPLATLKPMLFYFYVLRGFNSENKTTRDKTADSLRVVAKETPNIFSKIYRKGIRDEDGQIRELTAATLDALAESDPKEFMSLYRAGIKNSDLKVREATARSSYLAVRIDLYEFLRIHEDRPFLPLLGEEESKWTLMALASEVGADARPANDQFEAFIHEYLESRFTHETADPNKPLRNEEDIIAELVSLLEEEISHDKLRRVLAVSQAKDLGELIEHTKMSPRGYAVINKLGGGGWSNSYLIVKESSRKEKCIRFMKVPSPNLEGNKRFEAMVTKYGSIAKTLAFITSEEKSIHEVTIDTSLGEFGSYRYRPIPAFIDADLDVCVAGEHMPVLIYEYICGQDFDKHFASQRSEEETLFLFANGAYALGYIHKRGIIHNDVKGDNMRVAENGNVYLLDLAFTRFEDSGSSIQAGAIHTAPERLISGSQPTAAADQYSYGLMMYRAVVGEPAFSYKITDGDREALADQLHSGVLRPDFERLRSKVKPTLAAIIEKCLAFKPEDRYASMEMVEKEIREHLYSEVRKFTLVHRR